MAKKTETKMEVGIQPTKVHRCVKSIDMGDARISKEACQYLTDYVNAAIKAIFIEAYELATHAGRHTVKNSDICMAIKRFKVEGFDTVE